MKHSFLAVAAFAVILLYSCVKTPAEIAVTGVKLSEDDIELVEGQTHTLTATVLPDNATDKVVEWNSAVPSVATVSSSGMIQALAMGATTITVTTRDGGHRASCRVVVKKKIINVTSVSLKDTSFELTEGGSVYLSATVLPENATDRSVTWSAKPAGVLSVNESGMVTALAPGEGDVIVTTNDGGFTASCHITVKAKIVNAESVTLSSDVLELNEGETATLKATVLPENTTDKTLDWRTSDSRVATVDQDGKVTAVSAGNTSITVYCGAAYATCAVTVKKVQVEGVTIQPASYTLTEGETVQLKASVNPANADQTVEWASADTRVATVDWSSGLVTAVGAGKTKISARSKAFPDKQGSCEITVNQDTSLKGIALSSDIMTLQVGESRTLTVNYTPSYAANKNVTWSSSNPSVAAVGQDGTVTAFAEGKATVTATAEDGGHTASCEVTVSGSAGPMIYYFLPDNSYNYYGYINVALDPRNGMYDTEMFHSAKSACKGLDCVDGSLYTVELWEVMYEAPQVWLCKDRKPFLKLPLKGSDTVHSFIAGKDWYAIMLEIPGHEQIRIIRGDYSGNIEDFYLESSNTSFRFIYSPQMAVSADGSIQIAARIKDTFFANYVATYTIPRGSTVPQEALLERTDSADPDIVVDANGDVYVLSQTYNYNVDPSVCEVFIYKNGVKSDAVEGVSYNYSGAIACRDGHVYYAVSDYVKGETRIHKDGALLYTIKDKRSIYYSDPSPLQVSSSGDVYLALRNDDAALYKNGKVLYSTSYNWGYTRYCIIE